MALAAPPASLVFTTTRRNQQLISPSKPTPKVLKELSDLDDQAGLRFYNPVILFYGNNPAMEGRDPVKVIREALAEALVHFYPLAGRLREGPGRKITVDCTGEGVLFIEADAHDVTLEQFDHPLHPPFPCLEELFCSAPSPEEFLNSPLLLFQVTRLKCGGFIFAIQMNHSICDGAGLAQFMTAIGEMARGAHAPSVPPVWQRDLLNARNSPRITCNHHEQDLTTNTEDTFVLQQNMVQHSFFFSPTNVSTLRRLIPLHLSPCSTFELITACMWRCRTIALQFDPNQEVYLGIVVDARAKYDPPLPFGYYGNAIVNSTVKTIARKLCENSLGYALELVRKAKKEVTHEYMKSLADLIVLRDRQPQFRPPNAYQVSDLTRARFEEADFGWGKAAYGGPAVGGTPWITSYYTAYKDNNRKNIGFVVPICLPSAAMKRFIQELKVMQDDRHRVTFITSTL